MRAGSSGSYIFCEVDGGDVADHIDSYSRTGSYYWGDEDYANTCSEAYNDYTLITNEFFHDRTPGIRLYLRRAEE